MRDTNSRKVTSNMRRYLSQQEALAVKRAAIIIETVPGMTEKHPITNHPTISQHIQHIRTNQTMLTVVSSVFRNSFNMMRKAHFMKEETEFHVVVMDAVDHTQQVLRQVEDGAKGQTIAKPRAGVLIRKLLAQMDSTKTMDPSQSNTNVKNEIQSFSTRSNAFLFQKTKDATF